MLFCQGYVMNTEQQPFVFITVNHTWEKPEQYGPKNIPEVAVGAFETINKMCNLLGARYKFWKDYLLTHFEKINYTHNAEVDKHTEKHTENLRHLKIWGVSGGCCFLLYVLYIFLC